MTIMVMLIWNSRTIPAGQVVGLRLRRRDQNGRLSGHCQSPIRKSHRGFQVGDEQSSHRHRHGEFLTIDRARGDLLCARRHWLEVEAAFRDLETYLAAVAP